MRLRNVFSAPIGDRIRKGLLNIEAGITRWASNLMWHRSAAVSLEERRFAPPARFHELRQDDPVRVIVARVCAGEPIGEDDLAVLKEAVGKLDARNWLRWMLTAWALGRARVQTGQQEEVMGLLASSLQTRQYSLDACSTPCVLGCLVNWLLVLTYLAYGAVRDARINAIRTEAAASLALLDCEWAVGDLADAARVRNRLGAASLRQTATAALQRLLPRIGPYHYGRMPPATVPSLCRLLNRNHGDLHAPVLDALGHIGGSNAVRAVSHMTAEGWPAATRARAQAVLDVLQTRAERQRESERLLRPAGPPDAPEELLLRPVEAPPAGDTELLVRPVGGDQE